LNRLPNKGGQATIQFRQAAQIGNQVTNVVDLKFEYSDMVIQPLWRLSHQVQPRPQGSQRAAQVVDGVGDKARFEAFQFLQIGDVVGAQEQGGVFTVNRVDVNQGYVNVKLLAVFADHSGFGALIFPIINRCDQRPSQNFHLFAVGDHPQQIFDGESRFGTE